MQYYKVRRRLLWWWWWWWWCFFHHHTKGQKVAVKTTNGSIFALTDDGHLLADSNDDPLIFNDLYAYHERVFALTDTCVWTITCDGARPLAGSVTERGQRDGPPLFARFGQLTTFSASEDATMVLVDAARTHQNVVYMDAWRVRPMDGYFAQAHCVAIIRQNEVLVVTPTTAHNLARNTTIAGKWGTACAWFGTRVLLTSQSHENVWLWSSSHGTPLTLLPCVGLFRKLFGIAWAYTTTTASSSSSQPQFERVIPPCALGHVFFTDYCVQAPPGGYADDSLLFVPCPPQTHNPYPMATSADACLPCPPNTTAPYASSAVCTALPWLPLPFPTAPPATCQNAMVATLLPHVTTILSFQNGTMVGIRSGALLFFFFSTSLGQTVEKITPTPMVCMALSPDERLLLLADEGGALWQASLLGAVITATYPPFFNNIQTSAIVWSRENSLYFLDRNGSLWCNESGVIIMTGIVHAAAHADGGLVCALHDRSIVRYQHGTLLHRQYVAGLLPQLVAHHRMTVFYAHHALWRLTDTAVELLAGACNESVYRDDEIPRARLQAVTALVGFVHDNTSSSWLLVDNGALRLYYVRDCECPAQYFKNSSLRACAPCPPQQYAMPGARGCSQCPPNEFRNAQGECIACPWGWGPDPCRRMQNSLPHLLSLSDLETTLYDMPLSDFFCDTFWEMPMHTDLLGQLWASRPTRLVADAQHLPGLWMLCDTKAPGETCTCASSSWSLGNNRWGRAQAKAMAQRNVSFMLFGARGSSLLMWQAEETPPRLLLPHATMMINNNNNNNKNDDDDDGMCYVGWAAQYLCTDPFRYWAFQNGCVACPTGTWAPAPDDVACRLLDDCDAGLIATHDDGCIPCPPNTWAQHMHVCVPQPVQHCAAGAYLRDLSPLAENQCVPCTPCAESTTMIPFFHSLDEACPAGTRDQPPFVCVHVFFFVAGMVLTPSLRLVSCGNAPAHSVWKTGPRADVCYFACEYAVQVESLREYAFYLADDNNQEVWTNRFAIPPLTSAPQREAADQLCAPCDLSPCPVGMWRPLRPNGCGAPCLLFPHLCDQNGSSCIARCEYPLHHAHPCPNNNDGCNWQCDDGFFRHQNLCWSCMPSTCAMGEQFTPPCTPTSAYEDVCVPCSPLSHVSVARGECVRQCEPGWFMQADNRSCAPCAAHARANYHCPASSRVLCAATECTPCVELNTLQGRAVPVSTNDSVCRVQCKPQYHTIWRASLQVVQREDAYDPALIDCEDCALRPPCPLVNTCPPNETLLQQRCVPCLTSLQMRCAPGTYAPPCPGGFVPQMGCLACPTPLLPLQFFLPYSLEKVICPTACVAGTVWRWNRCIPCASLFPIPPNAPYTTYYSLWNAKDGTRWWPEAYDPPHLGIRAWLSERRAGLCWPCPISTRPPPPYYADGDLCTWPATDTTLSVPYWDIGTWVLLQNLTLSLPDFWKTSDKPQRRLLGEACEKGFYRKNATCVACPPNHRCSDGNSKQRCGSFARAPRGASRCHCITDFEESGPQCELVRQPLPADRLCVPNFTFSSLLGCVPCPANTRTTLPGQACAYIAVPTMQCEKTQMLLPYPTMQCVCGPGREPSDQNGRCRLCPLHHFSSHAGLSPCTRCPHGTFTLSLGAMARSACLRLSS